MAVSDAPAEVHEAAALAAEHAERSERERRLAPEVVEAMRRADLFRLCVPREIGGAEAAPRDARGERGGARAGPTAAPDGASP